MINFTIAIVSQPVRIFQFLLYRRSIYRNGGWVVLVELGLISDQRIASKPELERSNAKQGLDISSV